MHGSAPNCWPKSSVSWSRTKGAPTRRRPCTTTCKRPGAMEARNCLARDVCDGTDAQVRRNKCSWQRPEVAEDKNAWPPCSTQPQSNTLEQAAREANDERSPRTPRNSCSQENAAPHACNTHTRDRTAHPTSRNHPPPPHPGRNPA
eukprot:11778720-Alexandrium_andersonii.AAC.1